MPPAARPALHPIPGYPIYGSNFAPASFTDDWSKSIVNGELPTKLDGVSVNVGDQAAYVSYVSAARSTCCCRMWPWGRAGHGHYASRREHPSLRQFGAIRCGVLHLGRTTNQWATHIDYTLAAKNGTFTGTTTVPAKPGEVIILWGTGFGPTTPTAPAGVPIPVSPVYNTASPVAVMIDNVPASVYGTRSCVRLCRTIRSSGDRSGLSARRRLYGDCHQH